ncbi:MAG: rhomboid family intramembrane serine protease, partial [Candidatus Omnitrophica bacterium]|nr:rhomboid family intramembrane serine protease [Candidatus Omnitrophota bacterium]
TKVRRAFQRLEYRGSDMEVLGIIENMRAIVGIEALKGRFEELASQLDSRDNVTVITRLDITKGHPDLMADFHVQELLLNIWNYAGYGVVIKVNENGRTRYYAISNRTTLIKAIFEERLPSQHAKHNYIRKILAKNPTLAMLSGSEVYAGGEYADFRPESHYVSGFYVSFVEGARNPWISNSAMITTVLALTAATAALLGHNIVAFVIGGFAGLRVLQMLASVVVRRGPPMAASAGTWVRRALVTGAIILGLIFTGVAAGQSTSTVTEAASSFGLIDALVAGGAVAAAVAGIIWAAKKVIDWRVAARSKAAGKPVTFEAKVRAEITAQPLVRIGQGWQKVVYASDNWVVQQEWSIAAAATIVKRSRLLNKYIRRFVPNTTLASLRNPNTFTVKQFAVKIAKIIVFRAMFFTLWSLFKMMPRFVLQRTHSGRAILAHRDEARQAEDILKNSALANSDYIPRRYSIKPTKVRLAGHLFSVTTTQVVERADNTLHDHLAMLVAEGRVEEAKEWLDRFLRMQVMLWEMGLFEYTFQPGNYGVIGQRLVLLDHGEMTNRHDEINVKLARWHDEAYVWTVSSFERAFGPEHQDIVQEYFERMTRLINKEAIEQHWPEAIEIEERQTDYSKIKQYALRITPAVLAFAIFVPTDSAQAADTAAQTLANTSLIETIASSGVEMALLAAAIAITVVGYKAIKTWISKVSLPKMTAVAGLIIVNAVAFIAVNIGGAIEAVDMSIIPAALVEFRRTITYMFTHANVVHFAVNMAILWLVGKSVETKIGAWKLVGLYLLSGIGAVLIPASLGLLPTGIIMGASGAIYGLLLTKMILERRSVLTIVQTVILPIIFMHGFNVLVPGIDAGFATIVHVFGVISAAALIMGAKAY